MAFNVRKALAELMGKESISDAELRKELDELKIDLRIEALTKDGHLAADPEIQQLARNAITGAATPEQIEQLLRHPKPTPATARTIEPPTGPPTGSGDVAEQAIQAEMAKSNIPYHEAASIVAKGGAIAPAVEA